MTEELSNGIWKWFLGDQPTTLALPDYYANYFAYGFDWKRNPDIGLRIKGDYGFARYMSYNIYDEVSGQSLGALRDQAIAPVPGNVNPFLGAGHEDALNREYIVNVFCSDNASPATLKLNNALTFKTSDNVGALVVILRYYLPDGKNPTAVVELPGIKAFNTKTNRDVALLPNTVVSTMPALLYEKRLWPIFATIVDDTLRFYRVVGGGEFNNADNSYLISAVQKQANEVLIVNLQAPGFPHDKSENAAADVRYWSFNQGNEKTFTPMGTPDQQFRTAKDGRTYLAIGDPAIKERALAGGYNFMPWEVKSPKAVILYRNLVTQVRYPGGIYKVPELDLTKFPIIGPHDPRIKDSDAVNFIYAYAPTGKKVTQAKFLENYGGIPSPGFGV